MQLSPRGSFPRKNCELPTIWGEEEFVLASQRIEVEFVAHATRENLLAIRLAGLPNLALRE